MTLLYNSYLNLHYNDLFMSMVMLIYLSYSTYDKYIHFHSSTPTKIAHSIILILLITIINLCLFLLPFLLIINAIKLISISYHLTNLVFSSFNLLSYFVLFMIILLYS